MQDHFDAVACPTCGESSVDLHITAQAADALARALLAMVGDYPNYVETVLGAGGSDSASLTLPGVSLVVTIQRTGAKTPHQLRMEAEAERDQARDELAALRALLDADEPSEGYGAFPGGDPRTFVPDTEACTPEEIQAHAEACRLADEREAKGEPVAIAGSHHWTIVGGRSCHVAYEPFGIGTYPIINDEGEE